MYECEGCYYKRVSPNEYPCCDCETENSKFTPFMTNADRIRNMTDEKLAEYFKGIQEHTIKSQKIDSVEDMLQWLQTEVKEGNSNENT